MNAESHTLQELYEQYIAKNQRLKQSTQSWMGYAWQHLIDSAGEVTVEGFGHNHAEDFVAYLYGKDYPPSTIKGYTKACQVIFNWAWRRGWREGDPFRWVRKPRIPKREIRVYSDAELADILGSASMIQRRAMIMTAATAGLRRSEVLNLVVTDIDFTRGQISVQSKKETPHTWQYSPKSYQCRRVPLVEDLANLLTQIVAGMEPGQPYIMLTEKQYWRLQRRRAAGLMTERQRTCPLEHWSWFKQITRLLNIDATFHDLRKTAITAWTQNPRLSPQEVMRLAGHANIDTTMRYYAGVRDDIIDRARIGVAGFAPAASRSPTERSTELSYTPDQGVV